MNEKGEPEAQVLVSNLLAFFRGLRRMGFQVGRSEFFTALEALRVLPLEEEGPVREGLRAVVARSPFQVRLFNVAWRQYGYLLVGIRAPGLASQTLLASTARLRARWKGMPRVVWMGGGKGEAGPGEEGLLTIRGGQSPSESLKGGGWSPLTRQEREEMEAMALQPLWRRSRRRKTHPKGDEWDPSATLRRSLQKGEAWELARKGRIQRKERTVWICDVSGSMEPYSRMVLRFLHTLHRRKIPLEAFVVSTRLTRITPALKEGDADRALGEAVGAAPDWSGGTRLARGLKALRLEWGHRVLRGAGVVLVTDGLEGEDPSGLREEAARLRRWARWVVWLNPASAGPGYRPLARGPASLQKAVDGVWPAHNWEALVSAWEKMQTMVAGSL
ncbi:MAG: VWA domain-containing protein [Bacillota bacterium]|nr:VWA domain-containing protein [Bacillota bacterium]